MRNICRWRKQKVLKLRKEELMVKDRLTKNEEKNKDTD